MKASLKFRDDQRPLARAKIPISILGLPFLSGVSAGDTKELRLDLATAFDSGPSLRLSYRPNDRSSPFSLVLKTGFGALGSPASAPFSMSAEFLLPTAGAAPAFSVFFKPRLGDFHLRRTTRSATAPAAAKIAADPDESEAPVIGFPLVKSAAACGGGINGLLSGVELTARSELPLGSRAAARFRWGVKVPPEIRSGGRMSLGKLPLLVMSKVSIEHLPAEVKVKGKKDEGEEAKDACLVVSRELEGLKSENGLLRKAVEELRMEFGGGGRVKAVSPPADPKIIGGEVKAMAPVKRADVKPPVAKVKRADVKPPVAKVKTEGEEELKKALREAIGAGN